MSSLHFHELRVAAVEPETEEAVVVRFDVPAALTDTFRFTQGQYLTLRADVGGEDLRRSYSICAGLDDGLLRVGVRKVQGGKFSNWVNTELKAGDKLQVFPPQGRFFVPLAPEQSRHYLGIAGGSGITPILSIMKTVLAREPLSRFTLLYGNRRVASTMFKDEIEDLKNTYMQRLSLHAVFSDEAVDSELLGRHRGTATPVRRVLPCWLLRRQRHPAFGGSGMVAHVARQDAEALATPQRDAARDLCARRPSAYGGRAQRPSWHWQRTRPSSRRRTHPICLQPADPG